MRTEFIWNFKSITWMACSYTTISVSKPAGNWWNHAGETDCVHLTGTQLGLLVTKLLVAGQGDHSMRMMSKKIWSLHHNALWHGNDSLTLTTLKWHVQEIMVGFFLVCWISNKKHVRAFWCYSCNSCWPPGMLVLCIILECAMVCWVWLRLECAMVERVGVWWRVTMTVIIAVALQLACFVLIQWNTSLEQ